MVHPNGLAKDGSDLLDKISSAARILKIKKDGGEFAKYLPYL